MMAASGPELPAGARLNRLIATLVCEYTDGLPEESYPSFSTDVALAFRAIDAYASYEHGVTVTIAYPAPEVWIKRFDERFLKTWVPVAYVTAPTLPHAICLALLKACGIQQHS